MSRLNASQRRNLAPSEFIFPGKGPGPGSYPIPDRAHAIAALRFSAGKPEQAAVRAAVRRKYGIG